MELLYSLLLISGGLEVIKVDILHIPKQSDTTEAT